MANWSQHYTLPETDTAMVSADNSRLLSHGRACGLSPTLPAMSWLGDGYAVRRGTSRAQCRRLCCSCSARPETESDADGESRLSPLVGVATWVPSNLKIGSLGCPRLSSSIGQKTFAPRGTCPACMVFLLACIKQQSGRRPASLSRAPYCRSRCPPPDEDVTRRASR